MFRRFEFTWRYAARNLRRSGRWTTFAIFSIAAGVATVVALRSLGLAIGDSLVDNVRNSLHGDIAISRRGGPDLFTFNPSANSFDADATFTDRQIELMESWTAAQGGQMTAWLSTINISVTAQDIGAAGRPQFVQSLFIDPATFPPTQPILAQDPAGVPLGELFTGSNDVVISRNLADEQGIAVGDQVQVSGTDERFNVRGIVATENESGFGNLFASFFGFVYFDRAHAAAFQLPDRANQVAITLPEGTDIIAAERSLRAGELRRAGLYDTVPEVAEDLAFVSDLLGRFIVIMGLGALLIGGVGIINTMLVLVSRRSTEIAALKTFGLKGRQVSSLFLTEAFLLGLAGSIVGAGFGLLLSVVANQYGEVLLQQPLRWRFYPEAVAYGLGLGLTVTLVFGILPVLTANRIRPATILRPNETHIPGVSVFHGFVGLVLVVIAIGLIAGQILGNLVIGVIAVALTLIILGGLVGVMWVVVWLVSKLPAFGSVDLRLALRNLTSRRTRTAATLLALAAGMFALSSITFVGAGTREILQFQLTQALGGNVLVFPLVSFVNEEIGENLLEIQLGNIDGIRYTTRIETLGADLLAVNGAAPRLTEQAESLIGETDVAGLPLPATIRESDNPNLVSGPLLAGRDLTAADRGQPVAVIASGLISGAVEGLGLGSTIRIEEAGRSYDLEIVGVVDSFGGFVGTLAGGLYIPPGVINPDTLNRGVTIIDVAPENLNQVLLDLTATPLIFALDITFIDGLLTRLLTQFSAIPTLVGLLSLMAAAVIMANTVALATLERRRQIGILKAVGLKGRRVLRVMLLENTLIGLLGGLIGLGLSGFGVTLMTNFGLPDAVVIPRDALPVALLLIVAAVVIAWVATFLSARVAVGERVANVLRYE
ncbi:MAG: FtsX-like permease family protein [Chloroflexi bacterium]|nr:FtsX-like permease family protein [Chloroflexota bacterium]